MAKGTPFKTLLNTAKDRDILIFCPGKNIVEWTDRVKEYVAETNSLVIGCNKISNLIEPDFHLFTNNDKYNHYGQEVLPTSQLILGRYVQDKYIKKNNPKHFIRVRYTDRDPQEKLSYSSKTDTIRGYYRTSGNLAIMMSHLMGARAIRVAGMSGFMFQFDGDVHYYPNELERSDFKKKKEWLTKYDVPILNCLNRMKAMGIDFQIITPTFYEDHFYGSILGI